MTAYPVHYGTTLAVVLLGCGGLGSSDKPVVLRTDDARPLPRLAGTLLEHRMRHHADDLAALRASVRAADFPSIAAAAHAIAAEPRLSRPATAAGITLNDELPLEFFTLQDRLLAAAIEIERGARAADAAAVTEGYDSLRSTCTACHALYRHASGSR